MSLNEKNGSNNRGANENLWPSLNFPTVKFIEYKICYSVTKISVMLLGSVEIIS